MVISESLQKYLKERLDNLHKIVNIKHLKETLYSIEYTTFYQYGTHPPKFESNIKKMDLKTEMRDQKIDNILDFDMNLSDFDVENIIYTPEQRQKIEKLRRNEKILNRYDVINNSKKEYSEAFHIGQRVWYKHHPGIITFKHSDKLEDDITRWSIKVKDTEYRYVNGIDIVKREKIDISHIKIDPDLNKLSTEKLLNMFKSKRNKGIGNLKIKRILEERENIKIGDPKIIIIKK